MTGDKDSPRLGEAAGQFLAGLPAEEQSVSQQEIYRFVRWFGWEQRFDGLTAAQIANFAEQLSQSDADYAGKLELVHRLLSHAWKNKWSRVNLATHLRARKGKKQNKSAALHRSKEPMHLTQQGLEELTAELESLIEKSSQLVEDIRRAAADKDFKENAPLSAAREQRGQVEGRIMELREIIGSAMVIDEVRQPAHTVRIGDAAVLLDLASGNEVCYTLVGPAEVDAASGRISGASPLGKAIIGRLPGDEIQITVPAGKLRYRILRIGS